MDRRLGVAIIYGGRSGEHEISLRSAESIIAAIDPQRYQVHRILIDKDGRWQPKSISPEPGSNPGIDVAFPVLHGTFGEDGTVQGLLELAGIPYVGCGVLASSASMDKDVQKRLCKESGLPVVEHLTLTRGQFKPEEVCGHFRYPVFVKPANLGSSVGISKAQNCEELKAALDLAAQYDRKIIVERGIEGREFECAVLGNDQPIAAIPCEVIPSREFYDYEDKYVLNRARTILPASLTAEQTTEVQRLAVAAYSAMGCEGMSRVDFLLETKTGRFYVNEINTVPGFTSISMFPKMWEATGIPYPKLIDRLIELAMERHRTRQETRFSR